ncbi:MAG: hypothetical protein HYX87_08120 [Chloroflexi bacterium]|nr:hypothetical protein [Chloroflexota bacterium]
MGVGVMAGVDTGLGVGLGVGDMVVDGAGAMVDGGISIVVDVVVVAVGAGDEVVVTRATDVVVVGVVIADEVFRAEVGADVDAGADVDDPAGAVVDCGLELHATEAMITIKSSSANKYKELCRSAIEHLHNKRRDNYLLDLAIK